MRLYKKDFKREDFDITDFEYKAIAEIKKKELMSINHILTNGKVYAGGLKFLHEKGFSLKELTNHLLATVVPLIDNSLRQFVHNYHTRMGDDKIMQTPYIYHFSNDYVLYVRRTILVFGESTFNEKNKNKVDITFDIHILYFQKGRKTKTHSYISSLDFEEMKSIIYSFSKYLVSKIIREL